MDNKDIENQSVSFYALATEKIYLKSPDCKVFMVTVGDDGSLISTNVTDRVKSGEITAHICVRDG